MSFLSFFDPLQNRVLKVDDSVQKGAPMGNHNAAGPHNAGASTTRTQEIMHAEHAASLAARTGSTVAQAKQTLVQSHAARIMNMAPSKRNGELDRLPPSIVSQVKTHMDELRLHAMHPPK